MFRRRFVLGRAREPAPQQCFQVSFECRITHNTRRRVTPCRRLPREAGRSDNRHGGRRVRHGRRGELHHSLTQTHELIHHTFLLRHDRHLLDLWQDQRLVRATGEDILCRLWQPLQRCGRLLAAEKMDGVEGASDIEPIGPLQHVPTTWVAVRPVRHVKPSPINFHMDRLQLELSSGCSAGCARSANCARCARRAAHSYWCGSPRCAEWAQSSASHPHCRQEQDATSPHQVTNRF